MSNKTFIKKNGKFPFFHAILDRFLRSVHKTQKSTRCWTPRAEPQELNHARQSALSLAQFANRTKCPQRIHYAPSAQT